MVGIFDSGSGGLTVLRALRDVLPSCDVLYFGDIAHAPYGSRSQDELSLRTAEALRLLRERGAGRIISACNTVSASLALSLFDAFDLEPASIIEMVGPTVSHFKTSNERVLLCATEATVRAGIYQNAFRIVGKEVDAKAIPELAGAIEFAQDSNVQRAFIREAFKDTDWSRYDTLLLACTHYPLVLSLFREVVPAHVALFDPALAVAERAVRQFWPQEVRDGKTQFVISQDSEPFRTLVATLFPGEEAHIEVLTQ